MGLLADTAAYLFPPVCLSCSAALGPRSISTSDPHSGLCPECSALLRPLDQAQACSRCGMSPSRPSEKKEARGRCRDCDELPASFLSARSAFPYQSPAGLLIRNLKYHRAPYLAEWLVELAWPSTKAWLDQLPETVVVAPVPMMLWREVGRGYNQAGELARALAKKGGWGMLPEGTFLRVKNTRPQARYTTKADRRDNLAGAFAVKQAENIEGKSFLLVDDVMTTGATLASAAEELRRRGAESVFLYTIARARLGEDDDSDLAR